MDATAIDLSGQVALVTGTIMPVDGGTWALSGWIRDSGDDWILPPEIVA